MTVAMVPMTAFASTKMKAVDEISTGVGEDYPFTSRVELSVDDDEEIVDDVDTYKVNGIDYSGFEVTLTLTNGKFAVDVDDKDHDGDDEEYIMDDYENVDKGILDVTVENDTEATVVLRSYIYNQVPNGSTPITSNALRSPHRSLCYWHR